MVDKLLRSLKMDFEVMYGLPDLQQAVVSSSQLNPTLLIIGNFNKLYFRFKSVPPRITQMRCGIRDRTIGLKVLGSLVRGIGVGY